MLFPVGIIVLVLGVAVTLCFEVASLAVELACEVLEKQQGGPVGPVQVVDAEEEAGSLTRSRKAEEEIRDGLEQTITVSLWSK